MYAVVKPRFKQRLKAWWDGDDVPIEPAGPAPKITVEERNGFVEPKQSRFSARIECLNLIWGDGFCGPGDDGFYCDLVRPIGLNSELSMLELGAGLGGGARAIVKEYGVWALGFEEDRELQEAGCEFSESAGLGRKAEICHFQPDTLELPLRKFDCVFAKEFMSRIADKRVLIQQIEKSLKYGSHLFIVDFAIEDGDRGAPGVQKWLKSKDQPRHVLSPNSMAATIVESGLENRVARDITDRYLQLTTDAWRNWQDIVKEIDQFEEREAILKELHGQVRLWTELIDILKTGNLRVFSYHATKRSSGGIR